MTKQFKTYEEAEAFWAEQPRPALEKQHTLAVQFNTNDQIWEVKYPNPPKR